MTCRGRPVKKPARYCLSINSCPQVSAFQEGGSCKVNSREKSESRDARREERGKD